MLRRAARTAFLTPHAKCFLRLAGMRLKSMGVSGAPFGSPFLRGIRSFPCCLWAWWRERLLRAFFQRDMRPPPKLLGRGFPVFTNAELEPGAGPCGRRSPGEILAFSIVKLAQASDKILAAFKCAQAAKGQILQKLCLPCARSLFREMRAMRGGMARFVRACF